MSVFLSYSTADRKLAEKLRRELEQQGVSVWFDEKSLKPGDNWLQKIEEAIRSAEAILVLVGSRSSHDETQQATWRAALEAVWQNRDLPLIPLLIGDVGIPPFVFSDSINTPVIRLHDPADLPSAARTLRSVLRKDVRAYSTDPPKGDDSTDPPPSKGDYFADADRERQHRRHEIRQFVENFKN